MKTLLNDHVSSDTAYIVDDYPYGFRLRCKIKYWIETKEKFGQRLITQTSNPKKSNLVWNKPKAGNYWDLVVLYIDSKSGHVKHDSISIEYYADKLDSFVNEYKTILTSKYHENKIKAGRFLRAIGSKLLKQPKIDLRI